MDHTQALELIETAAAEPGGLDRLMAGDTADAAALAGHLAACTACGRELVRVRQTSETVREVLAASPDPGLRDRTLAYVRAVGRPRIDQGGLPAPAAAPATAAGSAPAAAPATAAGRAAVLADRGSRRARRLPLPLAWAASIAATAVIALGVGGVLSRPAAPAADPSEALARVALATLRVEAEPDAERVTLASTTGAEAAGSVVFSPSTGELVVIATDLPLPPEGFEYACWVETADGRRRMGRMFFGGGIAYWAGPVEGLDSVEAGDRFGVSLVPAEGDRVAAEPVLVGEL